MVTSSHTFQTVILYEVAFLSDMAVVLLPVYMQSVTEIHFVSSTVHPHSSSDVMQLFIACTTS